MLERATDTELGTKEELEKKIETLRCLREYVLSVLFNSVNVGIIFWS
jgi:hypothetical protein